MRNRVKEKLKNGEKPVGTFLFTSSSFGIESLGHTGIDYVIIDTEHSAYHTESLADLIRATENVNITPFVRISDISHKEIQRVADLGAQGVIIPLVRNMAQIRQIVNFAKFPPVGNRGFAPARSNKFGHDPGFAEGIDAFMKICNDNLMVLPQCETSECLEIIEDIIGVNGVDGIFTGPYDLSISLGIPLAFDNSVYKQAVKRIRSACKAENKPSFIYSGEMDAAVQLLRDGFDSVTYSIDAEMLANAYKTDLANIRKSLDKLSDYRGTGKSQTSG